MDTEEVLEIEKNQKSGRAAAHQGIYHYVAHWGAYYARKEGLLGGLFVGALVGVAIGAAAVGGLSLLMPLSIAKAGAVIGAFAGFGMLHGAMEFEQIGTVTGAVASAQEKAEERMKEFENSRFADLKREIRELKSAVIGQKIETTASANTPTPAEIDAKQLREYQTTHVSSHQVGERKMIFWKVAAMGILVGAAAGGLAGISGFSEELVKVLNLNAGVTLPTTLDFPRVSAMLGAAVGATYGINRDFFRAIFDVTDRWFRGLVFHKEEGLAVAPELPAQNVQHEISKAEPKAVERPALQTKEVTGGAVVDSACGKDLPPVRVLFEAPQEAPERSSMYFTNKITNEMALKALLAADHTRMGRGA